MKRHIGLLLVFVGSIGSAGCEVDSPEITIADFEGDWILHRCQDIGSKRIAELVADAVADLENLSRGSERIEIEQEMRDIGAKSIKDLVIHYGKTSGEYPSLMDVRRYSTINGDDRFEVSSNFSVRVEIFSDPWVPAISHRSVKSRIETRIDQESGGITLQFASHPMLMSGSQDGSLSAGATKQLRLVQDGVAKVNLVNLVLFDSETKRIISEHEPFSEHDYRRLIPFVNGWRDNVHRDDLCAVNRETLSSWF